MILIIKMSFPCGYLEHAYSLNIKFTKYMCIHVREAM